jgi:hypothetical protein
MYLKKSFNKKTGRTYLTIVHGYRDQSGKSRAKTIKSIGYLDQLSEIYADPIEHFTNVAKQMAQQKSRDDYLTFKIRSDARVEKNNANRKNYGHIVFSKIYHELELDRFFNNKQRHENFEFNSNSIMKVLVFARLLYPGSKKATVEIKDRFFDKVRIPAHPDTQTGNIRTVFRQHPDTCQPLPF